MVQDLDGQTVDGAEMVQCPAEKDGNCNRCAEDNGGLALCDAQADGKRIILFTQHGGHAWTRRHAAMVRNIAKACGVDGAVVEAGEITAEDINSSSVGAATKARYLRFMEVS
tara:strand:+ start:47 stop:382 length:336 start_codon:yes stop_codon:yes gene_type:complete